MNSTLNSKKGKKTFYQDCVFHVDENVYEPAEDTFLLAENLDVKKGEHVLDMGTGCGIIGVLAAKKGGRVVATDINPYALKCAEKNAKLNGIHRKIEFRLGNLFEPIKPDEKFSLIAFNAPYLPSEPTEEQTLIEKAWSGGQNGREVIDAFISKVSSFLAENGRVLLVQSSLSNIDETLQKFAQMRLEAEVIAKREVGFFESIVLIRAVRKLS